MASNTRALPPQRPWTQAVTECPDLAPTDAFNLDTMRPIGSGSFATAFLVARTAERPHTLAVLRVLRLKVAKGDSALKAVANELCIVDRLRRLEDSNRRHLFLPDACYVNPNKGTWAYAYWGANQVAMGDLMDLRKSIQNKPGFIDMGLVWAVAQQLVCAVNALHGVGVVHGDIKPDNVLFFPNGLVKLSDFGSATQVNTNILQPGTEEYKPTEYDVAPCVATCAGDVFSTGMALHVFAYSTFLKWYHLPLPPQWKNPPPAVAQMRHFEDVRLLIEHTLQRRSWNRWSMENVAHHVFGGNADLTNTQRVVSMARIRKELKRVYGMKKLDAMAAACASGDVAAGAKNKANKTFFCEDTAQSMRAVSDCSDHVAGVRYYYEEEFKPDMPPGAEHLGFRLLRGLVHSVARRCLDIVDKIV